jgi:hypothetical protein
MTPVEADRADTAARHHHDRGPRDHAGRHDDHAAIANASAKVTAMEAAAASACGIRRTKASDRTCNQHGCEKVLHVLSLHSAASRHR